MSTSNTSSTSLRPKPANNAISIIGMGNLGSALAKLIANNGVDVIAYDHDPTVIDEINTQHSNQRYLAAQLLPHNIRGSNNIHDVIRCSLLFITLPSRYIINVLEPIKEELPTTSGIVNLAKGIFAETGLTTLQTIQQHFPAHPTAMLSGPTLANEFSQQVPTAIIAASTDTNLQERIKRCLNNHYFTVQFSNDPLGTELGGVLKNIYALGFGIASNNQHQETHHSNPHRLNFIGAYITQAQKEIVTLGKALGAKETSFTIASGIGDLVATCLSTQSHNYTMGTLIAKGLNLETIQAELGNIPEGYNTINIAKKMAENKSLHTPLLFLIDRIIQHDVSADSFSESFIKIF